MNIFPPPLPAPRKPVHRHKFLAYTTGGRRPRLHYRCECGKPTLAVKTRKPRSDAGKPRGPRKVKGLVTNAA